MSWAGRCARCGEYRTDCECIDFTVDKVQQARETMKRESWVANVIRILGWTREEAEKLYKTINDKSSTD